MVVRAGVVGMVVPGVEHGIRNKTSGSSSGRMVLVVGVVVVVVRVLVVVVCYF